MNQVILKVEGMSCGGCVKSVERILGKQEGVKEVSHVEIGEAHLTLDEGKQSVEEIIVALGKASFPARVA